MTVDTSKPASKKVLKHAEVLRARSLSYPETVEDFPWDHSAFKVRGKVFLFLVADAAGLHVSVKLPQSRWRAIELPFATEAGYGLGKSGWVSASWGPSEDPPIPLLEQWIDESFRAVAPKRVSALVPPLATSVRSAAPQKATKRKATGVTKKSPASRGARKAAAARAQRR